MHTSSKHNMEETRMNNIETLEDVKNRLRKYIGTLDIHKMDINVMENAINVYVDKDTKIKTSKIIQTLRGDARSTDIIIIRVDVPKVAL